MAPLQQHEDNDVDGDTISSLVPPRNTFGHESDRVKAEDSGSDSDASRADLVPAQARLRSFSVRQETTAAVQSESAPGQPESHDTDTKSFGFLGYFIVKVPSGHENEGVVAEVGDSAGNRKKKDDSQAAIKFPAQQKPCSECY